jgi:hypothetical protein
MSGIVSTAGPIPRIANSKRHLVASVGARLLGAFRNFREGASWEPGRDWLTRVADPGERQEPR